MRDALVPSTPTTPSNRQQVITNTYLWYQFKKNVFWLILFSNRLLQKLKFGDFRVRRAVGRSRRTEKLRTGNSRSGSSRAPRSPAGRVPMRQHRSEFSGSPGGCRWKLVSLFLRFLLYKTLWRFATAISIYLLTYMGVFDLAYVSTYCQNCWIKPDIWHLGKKSSIYWQQ